MLAVVAVEQHHTGDVGTRLKLFAQQRSGAIQRAIVDEDDFKVEAEFVKRRLQTGEQLGEARLLVVDGNDNG